MILQDLLKRRTARAAQARECGARAVGCAPGSHSRAPVHRHRRARRARGPDPGRRARRTQAHITRAQSQAVYDPRGGGQRSHRSGPISSSGPPRARYVISERTKPDRGSAPVKCSHIHVPPENSPTSIIDGILARQRRELRRIAGTEPKAVSDRRQMQRMSLTLRHGVTQQSHARPAELIAHRRADRRHLRVSVLQQQPRSVRPRPHRPGSCPASHAPTRSPATSPCAP